MILTQDLKPTKRKVKRTETEKERNLEKNGNQTDLAAVCLEDWKEITIKICICIP